MEGDVLSVDEQLIRCFDQAKSRISQCSLDLFHSSAAAFSSFAEQPVYAGQVRLFRDGQSLPAHLFICSTLELGVYKEIVCWERVRHFYERGWTVLFRSIDMYYESVTAICSNVSELFRPFNVAVYCNCYISPPRSRGLNLHFDTHNVVVRHLAGSKYWRVGHQHMGVTSRWDRTYNFELDPDRLREPVALAPGDTLAIQTGTEHATYTRDDESIHLTFGCHALRGTDVVARMLLRAPKDVDKPFIAAREPLPTHCLSRSEVYPALQVGDPTTGETPRNTTQLCHLNKAILEAHRAFAKVLVSNDEQAEAIARAFFATSDVCAARVIQNVVQA